MDAITMLRQDHREVERLFRAVERTTAPAEVQRLAQDIMTALSKHAAIEEQVFYPAVEQALPNETPAVLKSLEAHHVAKTTLAEIDRLSSDSDRLRPKLLVLADSVRGHIAEEEEEMFPAAREVLGRTYLAELGEVLESAARVAPTKPHPHAPDTSPGNVGNLVLSIVDRARTAAESAVGRARRGGTAAQRRTESTARATGSRARAGTAKAARATGRSTKKSSTTTTRATKAASRPAKAASRSTKKATRKATGATKKATKRATGAAKKATKRATGAAKKATKRATDAAKNSSSGR